MADKILITGATGLIGQHLVSLLLQQGRGDQLHLLMRRACDADHGNATVHVAANAEWPDVIAKIEPDIAVSCLGSTMKKAGSKEAFAAIDRDLVGSVAAAAKAAGAKQFITVSSTMADSRASSFYLKTKGETEDLLRAELFERLDIIRPGLLRGERTGDSRLGESLAIAASPMMDMLLHGSLRRYRSIAAKDVAGAIAVLIGKEAPGCFVHENDAVWGMLDEVR